MRWEDHCLCADDGFQGSDHGLFEGSVTTLAGETTENHETAGNVFSIKLEAPQTQI
jgi:hypothetical protein